MLSRYVVSQVKQNSWFLGGLVLGLWLALSAVPLDDAPACAAPPPAPVVDDYEPQREERPDRASAAAGRSIQRPRYYSTELGMRAPLLTGLLAGAAGGDGAEGGAGARSAALNSTARLLQPALKFFITAGSRQASGGLANVVGFTDTREMLKPFHALKYLADNYLEEYDFFFLASDGAYINARRLTELVGRLSVSQHIYMGVAAEDDSHYCSLESGIILSNSVLRAIHGELDWCVRNSYSPRHHENIGRCVLHAAHTPCTAARQGETYVSASLTDPPELSPSLADAVTSHPVRDAAGIYTLHSYVSRVLLERAGDTTRALRRQVASGLRRHAVGFRNATWPGGLRGDPGMAPPLPASRFDLSRWTGLNRTHAFMPDELTAVAPLSDAHKKALDSVWEAARAWALRRWGASDAELVEGALRWEPAAALRYRLLLRLRLGAPPGAPTDHHSGAVSLRLVEVARPLGAARLAPVPYVTESARLALVLPVLPAGPAGAGAAGAALAFLQRYEATCLLKDRNTNLLVVWLSEESDPGYGELRAAAAALAGKYRAAVDVVAAGAGGPGAGGGPGAAGPGDSGGPGAAGRAAMAAALPRLAKDALVVLADARMEFNEDFLNRARMNTISGAQWFLPCAFERFATYAHPRAAGPGGARPAHHTGRFAAGAGTIATIAAFHRADYAQALAEWTASNGAAQASVPAVLARGGLRCLRAPEPGLVLPPPARPAACAGAACLRALRAGSEGPAGLALGARHVLAKILLEEQAERD